MKVLMINSVCGIRSTGRICTDIAKDLRKQGHEVKIAYGREQVPDNCANDAIRIGNNSDVKIHAAMSRIFDCSGFGSVGATKRFVEWVKQYDPDIIHLHNLHGYYINIEILFRYLKSCGKRIIWTLHDCWAFTGHCAFYDYADCHQWEIGCRKCKHKDEYPTSILMNRSVYNYEKKKQLFLEIPNLTIVTPSVWLKEELKKSFLAEYPVVVINNGVDINVFNKKSIIPNSIAGIPQKIILGVASPWHKRKGLDTFINLSKMIDASSYKIVLVGLSQQQIESLPSNIVGIKQTNDTEELAQLYSAAYVYVNPTLEDNYPTTNIESISCGTPVITYKTGGSTESAELFGYVVPRNNIEALLNSIMQVERLTAKPCNLSKEYTVQQYLGLYNKIV